MKIKDVAHVGVIGTGMIGTSLAVLLTGHGYRTTMLAVDDRTAADSRAKFDAFYQAMVDNHVMSAQQAEICKRYLSYTLDYKDLSDADYVFEAVVEELSVKHEVYRALEDSCSRLRLILSVSSALQPEKLVAGMDKYRDRIVVAHPFFPPHLIPYFEIVKSDQDTAEGITDLAKEFLLSLDRKPVVLKKSVPGFLGTRLQFAMAREAVNIVESGIADPEDVDMAAMYSFMPRFTKIGIFEHFDNGGLPLFAATMKNLFPYLSTEQGIPPIVQQKLDAGELGVQSGKGFRNWQGADLNDLSRRIAEPWWSMVNWELPTE